MIPRNLAMAVISNCSLDLIDTIARRPELSLFSEMLRASAVNEILAEGGAFTIFAPTNRAFDKLPLGRVRAMLYELDRTAVKNLILFHIIPGTLIVAKTPRPSATIAINPLAASDFPIHLGTPQIGERNIHASNGIIHVIGTVLAPAGGLALLE